MKAIIKSGLGILLCAVLSLAIFTGCGPAAPSLPASSATAAASSAPTEAPTVTVSPTEAPASPTAMPTAVPVLLPEDMPQDFVFSSGAGGWQTNLTLNRDGSFTGTYSDSEMGDQGADYPHGTVYICEFSGQFSNLDQLDEHTYSMTLKSISSQREDGEEWIADQIRYIASEPYGLESGTSFLLYAPDTPVEELSEDFLSWWPGRYVMGDEEPPATLSYYGLCNVETGYGFFAQAS